MVSIGWIEFLLVFDEDKGELKHFDNSTIENEAHGAGLKTAKKFFELQTDVLITGNGPGSNAATVLDQAEVKIYVGAGQFTVHEAFEAYKNSELEEY